MQWDLNKYETENNDMKYRPLNSTIFAICSGVTHRDQTWQGPY